MHRPVRLFSGPAPQPPRIPAPEMTEDQELATLSVETLRMAAERLGVDPFRLARFLGDGRLASILEALGRPSLLPSQEILGLADSYLEFLEREIEIRSNHRPSGSTRQG